MGGSRRSPIEREPEGDGFVYRIDGRRVRRLRIGSRRHLTADEQRALALLRGPNRT